MGVPTIGCDCAVCHSTDPHDRRTRPSILIEYDGKVVLIDTTPDFREQAIREANHSNRRGALHPHPCRSHSGHRRSAAAEFQHHGQKIPALCPPEAAEFMRKMFRYIFDADYKFGGLARLELKPIDRPIRIVWRNDLNRYR